MLPRVPYGTRALACLLPMLTIAACSTTAPRATRVSAGPADAAVPAQILRGRSLVLSRDCGGCHGGGADPAAAGWLAGASGNNDGFAVGDFRVWSRNLTPDPETGLARYTDQQVFNAIRYGLRPRDTPDVEITSTVPGVGNHPSRPHYLAPAMPWTAFRHMADEEIRDIVAYLRQVAPVRNDPPAGTGPADFWASASVADVAGSYPAPPFPTANEALHDVTRRAEVLQGRDLVVRLDCGGCHGGGSNPASPGWLRGLLPVEQRVHAGPFEDVFPGQFTRYSRNLTPHNMTGLGRFTERQIFNALRYGLRPGDTADVEIGSTVPGEGQHPAHPKYLAPPMPWPAWRHLSDEDLRAIAAYLKYGVKPVQNRVADSEGPPDFWRSRYTPEQIGPWPAAPFPTSNERVLGGQVSSPAQRSLGRSLGSGLESGGAPQVCRQRAP